MSMFSAFKENARLKSHMSNAKRTEVKERGQSAPDYSGPDGDIIVYLSGTYIGAHKTDGYLQAILEFSVLEGDHAGERLIKYFAFRDNDYGTAEEVLDEYYESIQRLGVETADVPDDQIEKALNDLKAKRVPQKLTVRTKNDRKRVYITGVATEGSTDYTYAAKEVEADEWGDVEDTPETAPESELSDWIGFKVFHKPARSPKEHEFEVVAVDEATQTMTLSKDGKTVANVPLDKIRFPE